MGSIEILTDSDMNGIAKAMYERVKKQDDRFDFHEIEIETFPNGEIKPHIPETVRHKDVYLIASLFHPDPNTSLIRLWLTMDAATRASARSINLIVPYMSYTRQDRVDKPRVPISISVTAKMLEAHRKLERLLTLDLHSHQIQGCFSIPVDNLYGSIIHQDFFRERYGGDFSRVVVVSPDHGGVTRARGFAKRLHHDVPVGFIDKRRSGPGEVEVMNYAGPDLDEKDAILYDDMIDTGGSLVKAAEKLRAEGADHVYAAATHGVFSSHKGTSAEEKLKNAGLNVVITETIPRGEEYKRQHADWLTVLPIDDLLARAILECSTPGGSISKLYE